MAGPAAPWARLRRGPALLALAAGCGLLADTLASATNPRLPFDPPVSQAVQAAPLGPLVPLFDGLDWLNGSRQLIAGLLVVALFAVLDRRAAGLALACAAASALYLGLNLAVRRPRPAAGLVHVMLHPGGYGFPSGHATFFTWLSILLVVSLAMPRVRWPLQALAWMAATLVIGIVCLSRVYEGVHWLSDVAAGVLLGGGWTAFAISVRRLSDPVLGKPGVRGATPGRLRR